MHRQSVYCTAASYIEIGPWTACVQQPANIGSILNLLNAIERNACLPTSTESSCLTRKYDHTSSRNWQCRSVPSSTSSYEVHSRCQVSKTSFAGRPQDQDNRVGLSRVSFSRTPASLIWL